MVRVGHDWFRGNKVGYAEFFLNQVGFGWDSELGAIKCKYKVWINILKNRAVLLRKHSG